MASAFLPKQFKNTLPLALQAHSHPTTSDQGPLHQAHDVDLGHRSSARTPSMRMLATRVKTAL